MFRNHNINKKNIKNQYSITTSDHTSNNILTTNISNQIGNDLNISVDSPSFLKLNNQKFPTSSGNDNQILSTNSSGVLSWVDNITGELINDTSPQLSANLDLNSNDITGTGGISISGDITCSNITVNGTNTFLDTSTIRTEDSLIYLGSGNTADTIDLGFYGKYVSSGTKYAGIFRDATDNKFKFFNSGTEPTTTITDFTLSDISCGTITSSTITSLQTQINSNDTDISNLSTEITNTASKWTQGASLIYNLNNNVGIGTNNPSQKLDVNGNIQTKGLFSKDGTVDTSIDNGFYSFTNLDKNISFSRSSGYRSYYIGLFGDNTNNSNKLAVAVDGGGGDDPNIISTFDASGSMSIRGNLCVGTESSGYKLRVEGDGYLNGNLLVESLTSQETVNLENDVILGSGNNQRFIIHTRQAHSGDFMSIVPDNSSGAWEWGKGITLRRDGKVGLGRTSPSYLLDVNGNCRIDDELTVYSSGEGVKLGNHEIKLTNSGVAHWSIINDDGGFLDFRRTSGSENLGEAGLSFLSIKSDGNVGIGTTSPSSKLTVEGNVFLRTGSTDWNLEPTNSSTFRITKIGSSGSEFDLISSGTFDECQLKIGGEKIRLDCDGDTWFNGGKVGIGTTTPLSKLHLTGTHSSATDGAHISITSSEDNHQLLHLLSWKHDNIALSFDCYYNGGWRMGDTGSSNSCCQFYKISDKLQLRYGYDTQQGSSISWNNGIILNLKNGNVGIGTNNPTLNLHIHEPSTDAGAYLQLTNDNTGTGVGDGFHVAISSSGTTSYLINRENGHMSFWTNNSEKMRIKNDGKVGIGTNNPVAQLDIRSNGDLLYLGTERPWKFHSNGTTGSGTFLHLSSTVAGKNFTIDHNGSEKIARFYAHNTQGGCGVYLVESGGVCGIGTSNAGSNRLRIQKPMGSNNMSDEQHNTQLALHGVGNKSMALGVMDNGQGMIQVKEMNVGYSSLHLQPISNNVMIGSTAIPTQRLEVNGNAKIGESGERWFIGNMGYTNWAGLRHEGLTTGSSYCLLQHNSGATLLNCASNQYIGFRCNNGDKMRLTNAGNLGIGLTNPSEKLEVVGNVKATGVFMGGETGSVVKIKFLQWSDGTDVNSSSWTVTKSLGYTKKIGTKLIIQCGFDYILNGYGNDTFSSRLRFSDDANTYVVDYSRPYDQKFDSHGGGGSRSNTLSGLCWETNSNFNNRTNVYIALQVRKNSADDQINVYEGYFLVHEVIA